MIHAPGYNISESQHKLQKCATNISSWYKIYRLEINVDKTCLLELKAQLKSLKYR